MRRLRGDRAPWQTDEYVDAWGDDEPTDHRGEVPDDIKNAVRRAYLDAQILHGCTRCAGTFWCPEDRDRHAVRCQR